MAGSLKRELRSKYGIKPKMRMAMGELEVLVNGQRVYSWKHSRRVPVFGEILADVVRVANLTAKSV